MSISELWVVNTVCAFFIELGLMVINDSWRSFSAMSSLRSILLTLAVFDAGMWLLFRLLENFVSAVLWRHLTDKVFCRPSANKMWKEWNYGERKKRENKMFFSYFHLNNFMENDFNVPSSHFNSNKARDGHLTGKLWNVVFELARDQTHMHVTGRDLSESFSPTRCP